MDQFLIFLALFFTGLFFAEFFNRIHVLWVSLLIFVGIVLGPFGMGAFTPNTFVIIVAEIGLVLLLFNAGLESRLASLVSSKNRLRPIALSLLSSLIIFVIVFALSFFVGLDYFESAIIGLVSIAGSSLIAIPLLERSRYISEKEAWLVRQTVLIGELSAILALAGFLESVENLSPLPLPLFYILFIACGVFLYILSPFIRRFFSMAGLGRHTFFRQELHTVFIFVTLSSVVFYYVGLHVLIASYLIGLILSSHQISTEMIREKLRAVSYGLFVPIFFIVFGALIPLGFGANTKSTILILVSLVVILPAVKFAVGVLSGAALNIKKNTAITLAAISIPQFTVAITVAYAGIKLGLVSNVVVVGLLALAMLSPIVGTNLHQLNTKRSKTRPTT